MYITPVTRAGAGCGDGDAPACDAPGADPLTCTWRAAVEKVVNKSCSDEQIYAAVEAHDAAHDGCFSRCPARHACGDPKSQPPIGHVRLSGVRRRRLWQAPTCRRMASAPFRTDKVMASHGGVGGSLLA